MDIEGSMRDSRRWEQIRHIENPHFGIPRTRTELDEAEAENDLFKKLEEVGDVYIVLMGAAASICDTLNIPYSSFIDIIAKKREINDIKYDLEYFRSRSVEDGINASRHYHNVGLSPEEIAEIYAGDCY